MGQEDGAVQFVREVSGARIIRETPVVEIRSSEHETTTPFTNKKTSVGRLKSRLTQLMDETPFNDPVRNIFVELYALVRDEPSFE